MPAPAAGTAATFDPALDEAARQVIAEELDVLEAVQTFLRGYRPEQWAGDYGAAYETLRESLGEVHEEDEIAQLLAEMDSLAHLSTHREAGRYEAPFTPESPYFGHLRVRQGGRVLDVLIGNRSLVASGAPYPIIDWRHAPISGVFYSYDEGEEYEETFAGQTVSGEVLARRTVVILGGRLMRIQCARGVFQYLRDGWRRVELKQPALHGGAGTAVRPGTLGTPQLGVSHDGLVREDRHLPAITGLIDAQQFEVITRPESGIVVVDGGAGSGKTTIALHRLAYLAYRDPERFEPRRMLAVMFNRALAEYVSRLLPELGVDGVRIEVFERFAAALRRRHFADLPVEYAENPPYTAVRLKSHPALLQYLEEAVARRVESARAEIEAAAAGTDSAERAVKAWDRLGDRPLGTRLAEFRRWVEGRVVVPGVGGFGDDWLARQRLQPVAERLLPNAQFPHWAAIAVWEELFLRLQPLREAMTRLAPGEFSVEQLEEVRDWALRQYGMREAYRTARDQDEPDVDQPRLDSDDADEAPVSEHFGTEAPTPEIDREDDTLLLLLYQLTVGPLRARRQRALRVRHLMVDEAQDFSPLDLKWLLELVEPPPSVTLAGDAAQRMFLHNAFRSWEAVLYHLGLEKTAVSPLEIGYRSTDEIMTFARSVLGDLETGRRWEAVRSGAPVELFRFTDAGQAVAMLTEALRVLMRREPTANVALVARYPEQADVYHEGLTKGDLPRLRRVAEQDFAFAPGIEVTDITQVKGLEFDYVVLLDVDDATYPADAASRYLLHIGATRAAHQLWLIACRTPSPLIPADVPVRLG